MARSVCDTDLSPVFGLCQLAVIAIQTKREHAEAGQTAEKLKTHHARRGHIPV